MFKWRSGIENESHPWKDIPPMYLLGLGLVFCFPSSFFPPRVAGYVNRAAFATWWQSGRAVRG